MGVIIFFLFLSVPIFGESESEGIASVDIKCSKGVLSYEDDDEDKSVAVETREKLSCYSSQPELYAGYSCGGSAKSLLYGLTVQQKQVVLSTFCYNFNTMDIMYISYTSSDSSVLQDTVSELLYSQLILPVTSESFKTSLNPSTQICQ